MENLGFENTSDVLASDPVTMLLIPDQSVCKAGTIPDFTVTIKNTGSVAVKFCTYMLIYRLKAAMIAYAIKGGGGVNYEFRPFFTQKWDPESAADFRILKPGEEIKEHLKLSADKQFGFIARHSQPPVIPVNHIIKGFPAGTYDFNTALSDQMAVYAGENGVFDFKLDPKSLFKFADGLSKDAYFDLIEATARVDFK